MKRLLLSVLTVAALTTGSAYSASPLSSSAACRGEIFNPINDANWNNMFPVTVAGISMGGGSNPSLMHMDPICLCPGPYGIDMPGIGMTFWEPTFLAEVARTPGCMPPLGGTQRYQDANPLVYLPSVQCTQHDEFAGVYEHLRV